MRYDLHVHTSRYSACSISSPEAVCRRAVETGLTGIALTEHDLWWPFDEIEPLQERFPMLTIFRGAEYTCPEGDFLVFLPDPEDGPAVKPGSILRLAPTVHRLGGVVLWAHPFRFDKAFPTWIDQVQLDGMEVMSSNMDGQIRSLAQKLAHQKGIKAFRNSDTHHVDMMGRHYNEIPALLKNNEDLVKSIRNGF